MNTIFTRVNRGKYTIIAVAGLLFISLFGIIASVGAAPNEEARNGRLVTFHDRGEERVILTHAQNVRDALEDANISVVTEDAVEPGLDTQLVATNYTVNIYRARPVIVVDGAVRQKVMTAAQTAEGIASAAGIELRDEDEAELTASDNIVADGASTMLQIDRATAFTLNLYGAVRTAYSQAATVGEMLASKHVKLGEKDTVSVGLDTPLKAGMKVSVWRDGVQTATVDEAIKFPVRQIQDFDQPVGYKKIKTPGVKGKKSVTYEITTKRGVEVKRKVIQSIVLKQPKTQVEIVGAKPGTGLTKSKGVNHHRDSNGVLHRETYYDLPMNVVMGYCGGKYTVRADGTKVDQDGYVIVAANLSRYPRCSVVETSLGKGKVYDTGGFAAAHPDGFDLATDWSNNDGV